jgi:type 1 glutamine amidotransferase
MVKELAKDSDPVLEVPKVMTLPFTNTPVLVPSYVPVKWLKTPFVQVVPPVLYEAG